MSLPQSQRRIKEHFADVTTAATARDAWLLLARDGNSIFERRCCCGHRECNGLHGEEGATEGHEFSGVVQQQPVHGATDSAVSGGAEEYLSNK